MRQTFIDWNPNVKTRALLADIKAVLEQYESMDIRLTLRQLYYQLVTKNIIANRKAEYSKLSAVLTNARLAGLVDWNAIEDRVRRPERAGEWDSIQDLVASAVYAYRLPRWNDQENHVELWCEKDAIHSVISPIAHDLHTVLMVNRGYSSASAMYDASNRFKGKREDGKRCHILYLGDFDPSGEDMVRDIRERMRTFGAPVNVTKIALNREQVEEHKLPPNPAKMSDPRAGDFVSRHGDESYEVDALPPQVLMKLVRSSIEDLMDLDAYLEVKKREQVQKEKLKKLAAKI